MPFVLAHPLSFGALLLLIDAVLWHAQPFKQRVLRVGVRLALFMVFSALIINAGVSPLQAPLLTDDPVMQLGATALGILWWLYAARVLTELIGLVLMRRIGHSGRLLQDVIGALVFLAAIVAAAAYILELPVKGLLATSGVVAIVIGLALQSTLTLDQSASAQPHSSTPGTGCVGAYAARQQPAHGCAQESVLADSPSQATFTPLTSIIYRIDKSMTRECMAQRSEVGRALNTLKAVREQSSRSALMAAPAPIKKGGFLSWLQTRQ